MAFDIFSAIMAVLSILSFGAISSADIGYEPVSIPTIEVNTNPAIPDAPGKEAIKPTIPVPTETPDDTALQAHNGADQIAGTWTGSGSVPFVVSVTFKAVVAIDGTAQFSGTVTSSMFGNHIFNTPATWTYLGGTSFDTVISNVHTPVTCDGKKLSFPLNPYKLGLVNNKIADQNFVIDLYRI